MNEQGQGPVKGPVQNLIKISDLKNSQINSHFAVETPYLHVFEVELFIGCLQIALSRCHDNDCFAIVAIATVFCPFDHTIRFLIDDLVKKHLFPLLKLLSNSVNKP